MSSPPPIVDHPLPKLLDSTLSTLQVRPGHQRLCLHRFSYDAKTLLPDSARNVQCQNLSDLTEINKKWNIKIQPASYAFAIWGIIYLTMMMFVVYQALPEKMVPSRNNDFIFSQVGYWFSSTMFLNGLWLMFFTRDNKWTFLMTEIVNFLLLVSTTKIMMMSCRASLNGFESVVIRTCFSLFSGWVTFTNMLYIFFILKSWKNPAAEADDFQSTKEEAD